MQRYLKWVFVAVIALVIAAYFGFMIAFQSPVVCDITADTQFFVSEKEIELPWYLDLWLDDELIFEGTDAAGNLYTWFSYDLPDLFEDSEAIIVVAWQDCRATLFAGESRAMDVVDVEFPMVEWVN